MNNYKEKGVSTRLSKSPRFATIRVMVVLRVPMKVLSQKDGAVQLPDCECIGLHISDTVNGDTIAPALADIFRQAGTPADIIKDCDRTLNKGVSLWPEKQNTDIPVIEDISHVMAAALKKRFEDTDGYREFTSLIGKGAKNRRQTALSFLQSPSCGQKGAFSASGSLVNGEKKCWTYSMLKPEKALTMRIH